MRYLLVLLYIVAMLLIIPAWTVDDAFITYAYGKNLLAGSGLVFNAGQYVEGYTGILWVLVSWAVLALNINIVIAAKVINVVLLIAGAWFVYKLIPEKKPALYLALLYLMPVQFLHAYAGMETILFQTLIIWAIYNAVNNKNNLHILIALCLVRPEGKLVALVLSLYEWKRGNRLILLLVIMAIEIHVVFRYYYYGTILPHTYDIKSNGIDIYELMVLGGVWLTAFYYLYKDSINERIIYYYLLLIIAPVLVAYHEANLLMNYAARFYIPFLPLIIIIFYALVLKRLYLAWGSYVIVGLLLFITVITGMQLRSNKVWLAEHKHLINNLQKIGETLKGSGPVIAWDIGAVKYYSGSEVIDMVGLTDPGILKAGSVPDYVFSKDPEYFLLPSYSRDNVNYPKYHLPELLSDARIRNFSHVKSYFGSRRHYHILKRIDQ